LEKSAPAHWKTLGENKNKTDIKESEADLRKRAAESQNKNQLFGLKTRRKVTMAV